MKKKSFTAIETLLTIGVIAVTTGVSIPMYRNFQIRTDLDLATEQTIQALRSAQVRSQAGEEDAQWGVWTSDGVIFQGETYSLRNPDADEEYPIPSTISVSGLSQVTFSRVDGIPQYVGDIVLEAINGDQRTITISADGVLSSTGIESPVLGDDDDDDDDDDDSDDDDSDDDSGDDDSGDDDSGSDDDSGDDDSGSDDDTVADDDSGDDDTVADDDDSGSDDDDSDSGSDEPTEPCEDRFEVNSNGTIETTGTVDATFRALGSEITYGAGGPEIQVTVEASTDGGSTWTPLFGGRDIDGGEEQVIENLPSGSQIVLRFKGRHGWLWQKTYRSNDQTGHVEVLRDGASPPDYQPYDNQASLETFLQEIIGDDGKISIGEYDAVLLGELGTLRTASSDFQDAVVLIQFAQKTGSCAGTDDPRFKIDFERLENFGTGNAARSVYVGPQQIRYAEGQWIPLKVNGVTVVDGGIVEDVPGVAVERRNGSVRVLLHGSHPSGGSKEIVDARVTFDGAVVHGADNDTGSNESENPFDNIVNDGPSGDEITLGTSDALYQARVTILDDAIFINWLEDSSVDADGDDDDTADDSDDADDDDSDDDDDSCSATYSLNNGRLVLNEDAHVTFRVLGSHATHGLNGPEVSVRMNASLDDGNTWQTLYNFRDVDGGEQQSFTNVSSGSSIILKAEGRYGWLFKKTAHSRDTSGRIRIFEDGDDPPTTSVFANEVRMRRFMRNIMHNGKININSRRVLALVELQDLNTSSDFSDAAVEIVMERPACGSAADDDDSDDGDDDDDSDSTIQDFTICHYPPGNRANHHTLTVSSSAWPAHRRHGDRLGSCAEDRDGDGIANYEDLCPDTGTPEVVPRDFMLFGRFALTEESEIFRKGPRKRISPYTLRDTKGCSCEQLLDVAEDRNTYYFSQYPILERNMKGLFPHYTRGARNHGCSVRMLRMVQRARL